MKRKIDGIIVVEGKTDVAFLSSFIDAEFVITNGSEISSETIEYLKNSAEKTSIFVLTDPDFPGKRIRDILDQNIPNLIHCFVSKEKSIKHNKVGVAESTKEEVLSALDNHFVLNKETCNSITQSDLFNLGLVGDEDASIRRESVCRKYFLGHCNAKTFLKRINSSCLTIDDLKSCL